MISRSESPRCIDGIGQLPDQPSTISHERQHQMYITPWGWAATKTRNRMEPWACSSRLEGIG